MEKEFFDLFNKKKHFLYLSVTYLSSCDWVISITDRRDGDGLSAWIVHHQDVDRNLLFSKAYVSLAEWYSKEFGGY